MIYFFVFCVLGTNALSAKQQPAQQPFLSFSGRRDRTRERAPGISKKLGEAGKGEREGEEDGEKGYRLHSQPVNFIELRSSTNGERQCNLIGQYPVNQKATSESRHSCKVRHLELDKIKTHIALEKKKVFRVTLCAILLRVSGPSFFFSQNRTLSKVLTR